MPHISVMIPSFNHAGVISKTIESVLNQQFKDFDVVVIDDASTDQTTEIVEQYCLQDSRIQLVVNNQNLGLNGNWNRCLNLAVGPLVQLLLADDLIDSDYLACVSEIFEKYQDVGIVAASCRYIDNYDQIIHPGTVQPPHYYQAGDEAVSTMLTKGYPHVSSIVVRKLCYQQVGGFDEAFWFNPDVEMDVRLAAHYDFYHLGQVYTSFRRHGSNAGNVALLYKNYLPTYMHSLSTIWGYLSPAGRHKLGVDDLDIYVAREAARFALTATKVTIAYKRRDLAKYYLEQALKLDHLVWYHLQFWKAIVLFMLPGFGETLMQRRMKILEMDFQRAQAIRDSLATRTV